MRRCVPGRAKIVEWLSRQIPIRHERGGGDLVSELCRAKTVDGELMSAPAVVDHMSFLMMAAHDTLTSSLSVFQNRYEYVLFGGGAHMCIGLNFAYMQAKCFARYLLQNVVVSVAPGYVPAWKWPIPQPNDGLQLNLSPL
jgi:cytochrome P450